MVCSVIHFMPFTRSVVFLLLLLLTFVALPLSPAIPYSSKSGAMQCKELQLRAEKNPHSPVLAIGGCCIKARDCRMEETIVTM